MLKALSQAGYNLESKSSLGITPLLSARLCNKYPKLMKLKQIFLLEKCQHDIFSLSAYGLNIKLENKLKETPQLIDTMIMGNKGETPLFFACYTKQYETIDLLLNMKADVDHVCRESTPLVYAVHSGCLQLVRKLIQHGANVNFEGMFKRTPLHYAYSQGHADIAKFLIENGANEDLLDETGKRPKDLIPKHNSGLRPLEKNDIRTP